MKADDIFISYAREDREFARRLAAELEGRGWSVWWDREIPAGQRFDEIITRALAGARCVVVVWSRASVKSGWVRDEAADALERGILVPVLIDDVEPPLGFRSIQLADLREWEPGSDSEEFSVFTSSVAGLVEGPAVVAEPERQALARPKRRRLLYGAATALALAIGLAGYWLVDFGDSDTGPSGPVAGPPPPDTRLPPPDTSPPPPPSWQPNPDLPLAFDESHEFYENIRGWCQGTVSDGKPGHLFGTFGLESKQKLRGIKAFVLVHLLDDNGNVLQEHKARTWVDGTLSLNRKKHTVSFNEEIDESVRPWIRSCRVRFVEEE